MVPWGVWGMSVAAILERGLAHWTPQQIADAMLAEDWARRRSADPRQHEIEIERLAALLARK
jgi:hypothetical protein